MSLILFLASLASATEPSVVDANVSIASAKEARSAAIDGYRKKLETQKSAAEAKLEAANTGCADAKTVWLAMQEPLSATNTELKLVPLSDVSPEIAAANAAYRKELEKLKAGYDVKIAQALKDAVANGVIIKAANADVDRIGAELRRLDDQEAKERKEAEQARCEATAPRAGACLSREIDPHDNPTWTLLSAELPPLVGYSRRVVYLPAEFATCFPNEVRPEHPEMMIGTKNNNL